MTRSPPSSWAMHVLSVSYYDAYGSAQKVRALWCARLDAAPGIKACLAHHCLPSLPLWE